VILHTYILSTPTKAWKLLKVRSDGSLGPLFINTKQRIEPDTWYKAEDHPTPGYKHRPGWHVAPEPNAPHLSLKGRVWCQVEIDEFTELKRPESQGGTWYLAKWMRVLPPSEPTP
jgi:hypothetical protein